MQTKFVVNLYGSDQDYPTREAAELALELNACGAERVNGEYVREVKAAPAFIHYPTGKTCSVLRFEGERAFCNFGAAANPFTWVDRNELVSA